MAAALIGDGGPDCAYPSAPCLALMLEGGLGSGKTTLVRSLVESLPGGDQAEVSSPSFNLYNLYPTTPETAHFDLYRLEGMPLGESGDTISEMFYEQRQFVVVEWCQFLPKELWPDTYLHISWHPANRPGCKGRTVDMSAQGYGASVYLNAAVAAAGDSILVKEP